MQTHPREAKLQGALWMLIASLLCGATMLALLGAAIVGAPGTAFITICAIGLTAVVAMVLLGARTRG